MLDDAAYVRQDIGQKTPYNSHITVIKGYITVIKRSNNEAKMAAAPRTTGRANAV